MNNLSVNIRRRINPKKVVHIIRSLQGSGKILVNEGQIVQPFDVIGKSTTSGGFSMVNIARALGVDHKKAINYLHKGLGSKVFKGELIASKKGFLGIFNKIVVSPTDCVLDSLNPQTSDLKLILLPKENPLLSGVVGVVDKVTPNGEVLIRTMVTEIAGVYGSGKQRFGPLVFVDGREGLINESQINDKLQNSIVIGGATIFSAALRKAVEHRLTGIIIGGMNARDFKSTSANLDYFSRLGTDIGVSIVATEGFGPIPIGEDIFELLKKYSGQFVFISGNSAKILLPSGSPNSIIDIRKTALPISQLSESQPEVRLATLQEGLKVRVIWPPFMGTQGKIVAIDKTQSLLPSGLPCYLVTIETRSRKLKIPYTNIEAIYESS